VLPHKEDYHLVIKANDTYIVDVYLQMFDWYIKNKIPVPYRTVQGFLQTLYDEKTVKKNQIAKKATELSKIAETKLFVHKDYQFEWTEKYTTTQVIFECFFAFLLMRQDYPTISISEVLSFYYDAISDYNTRLADQKSISHYKRAVIAGVLTEVSGYKIVNKSIDGKNPSNAEIFQATKNTLSKKRN